MNNLNLHALGVQEINSQESKVVNGGDLGIGALIAIGIAIAAGTQIFGDWDDFKAGLSGKKPVQS